MGVFGSLAESAHSVTVDSWWKFPYIVGNKMGSTVVVYLCL